MSKYFNFIICVGSIVYDYKKGGRYMNGGNIMYTHSDYPESYRYYTKKFYRMKR